MAKAHFFHVILKSYLFLIITPPLFRYLEKQKYFCNLTKKLAFLILVQNQNVGTTKSQGPTNNVHKFILPLLACVV